jgi:hypothetical protein
MLVAIDREGIAPERLQDIHKSTSAKVRRVAGESFENLPPLKKIPDPVLAYDIDSYVTSSIEILPIVIETIAKRKSRQVEYVVNLDVNSVGYLLDRRYLIAL